MHLTADENLVSIGFIHNSLGHVDAGACHISAVVDVNNYIVNILVQPNTHFEASHLIAGAVVVLPQVHEDSEA